MPLAEYRDEVTDFSELFGFCQFFSTTPDRIESWREENPHTFSCFRHFFSGMSRAKKEGRSTGVSSLDALSKFDKSSGGLR